MDEQAFSYLETYYSKDNFIPHSLGQPHMYFIGIPQSQRGQFFPPISESFCS